MNLSELAEINYDFARNILSRAIVRNPQLFYNKYITMGYDFLLNSLKAAWLNCAKKSTYPFTNLDSVDIDIEISHVYSNGDFFLLTSLPNALTGCDLIGFYITEDIDEALGDYTVNINYYIFYKTKYLDKYLLLSVDKEQNLINLGYISTFETALIKDVYNKNKKRI